MDVETVVSENASVYIPDHECVNGVMERINKWSPSPGSRILPHCYRHQGTPVHLYSHNQQPIIHNYDLRSADTWCPEKQKSALLIWQRRCCGADSDAVTSQICALRWIQSMTKFTVKDLISTFRKMTPYMKAVTPTNLAAYPKQKPSLCTGISLATKELV